MAQDGAVVQQVVVTASEKRCWGIIERGRGSGSELFNQKGGELKGKIKMFLRFPDGLPPSPRPWRARLSFSLSLPPIPIPKEHTLSWGNNKNNLVFEWGGRVKRNKSIFFCMLKRTSHPNKSMKIFADVCVKYTHTMLKHRHNDKYSCTFRCVYRCIFSCKSPLQGGRLVSELKETRPFKSWKSAWVEAGTVV